MRSSERLQHQYLGVRMAIGRYAANVANITAASSLDCEHADTLNQQYICIN
jgi:uncharacterized protein